MFQQPWMTVPCILVLPNDEAWVFIPRLRVFEGVVEAADYLINLSVPVKMLMADEVEVVA